MFRVNKLIYQRVTIGYKPTIVIFAMTQLDVGGHLSTPTPRRSPVPKKNAIGRAALWRYHVCHNMNIVKFNTHDYTCIILYNACRLHIKHMIVACNPRLLRQVVSYVSAKFWRKLDKTYKKVPCLMLFLWCQRFLKAC
jgi:hypothetical protein